MKRVCLLFLVFTLAGCGIVPTRVFTAKVPDPISKPAPQLEAERRAADLIARKVETPAELKPVARGLSNSLGLPQIPTVSNTPAEFTKAADSSTAELQVGLVKMQKQIEALNKNLSKYQGKEIEGTGLSLVGPGFTFIIIAIVALGVLCPPALTMLFFAFRRLKAAAGIVVNEMEDACKSPETAPAIAVVKQKVAAAMKAHPDKTELLKGIVTKLKRE